MASTIAIHKTCPPMGSTDIQKGEFQMKTRMFLLAALIATLLVGGFTQGAFAKGGGTKTIISLQPAAGFANAIGKAKYKVDGSKREFEVEAEHIWKLSGKTVSVFVNGTKVG